MAKIKGALHSVSASGTLGRTITFCKSTNQQNAKNFSSPRKPPSAAQLARRKKYKKVCWMWANTDPFLYFDLTLIAQQRKITLFNAFVHVCMSGLQPVPLTEWDDGATVWEDGDTLWDLA